MYNTLFSNIAKHVTLTKEEMEAIQHHVQYKHVRKNETLLEEGAYCRHLYFVVKGCLRLFAYDGHHETTVLFAPENWWMSDIESFTHNKPSIFCIEALEDAELISIEYQDWQRLMEKVPKVERFFRILFQHAFALYQRRMNLILSKDARERYAWFGKQYPKLELRIAQKYIASYLGITTVFLSNIRKKG